MSFWDNVKKFAQPYSDEDYYDYDEELDGYEEEETVESAPRSRRTSPFASETQSGDAFESAASEQFPNADLMIFCGEGKATVKLGEESVELAGLHAALVKDAVGVSVTVTAQEDACFMIAEVQV